MVGVCMWEVGGNDIRYTGHYSSGHICRAWIELDGDEKGGNSFVRKKRQMQKRMTIATMDADFNPRTTFYRVVRHDCLLPLGRWQHNLAIYLLFPALTPAS